MTLSISLGKHSDKIELALCNRLVIVIRYSVRLYLNQFIWTFDGQD